MAQPVVHFEIGSKDLGKICSFYSALFGWDVSEQSPFVVSAGKEDAIGGHINCLGHEPHNYVTVYVQVDDLQASIDRAVSLGGREVVPPTEVPQMGRFAWISDPEGNTIGLWKPKAS